MRYVRDTDYWNIDRVIRCFTISEITRMYPHSWKNCMQVGDILQAKFNYCLNYILIKYCCK